jgi:signal transduction histidine kinase
MRRGRTAGIPAPGSAVAAEVDRRRQQVRQPAHEAECRVHVQDTGPGFSENMRAQFGEAYAQDNTLGSIPKGTGLGLAISKRMAAAMGGELYLADGEEPGAEVVLRLERATHAARGRSALFEMVAAAG